MSLLTLLYLFTLIPLLLLFLHSPTSPNGLPRPREPLLYALLSAQVFLNTHLFLSIILSPPSPLTATPPNSFFGVPCYILEYYTTWLAGFLMVMLNARYILRKEWVPVLFVYNALCGAPWVTLASGLGRVCVAGTVVRWGVGFCLSEAVLEVGLRGGGD
ncbi:hypothetical protein C7212DRAFT_362652 [Tuber magnatum]|uniref:Uncharacterized protein n=1 Tax=Tuber magnatum TaxID=42249 RepID=A0A317SV56_9PEZI|nr:hypothetical protein C7212DRAFT_362652 [Tuber magnatum]